MIVGIADTHTIVWYLMDNNRLSPSANQFLETSAQDGNQIGISSITLVEIVYLIEKGRIAAESLTSLASRFSEQSAIFVEIPLDLQITRTLSRIPSGQIPDMPDHIIAATALHLNVPLVSRDSKIRLSAIQTIW